MKYNVLSIPPFDRQLKRLAGKYHSLKAEYAALVEELEKNPEIGIPMGNKCFKIRLAIASKGRGKSGGARIITHFYIENNTVFLLAIYDKSEQTDISDKELKELLWEIENLTKTEYNE
jgi:mRNA-degrading endonuclease RelE of RelBE toxin-antitoxin system